MKKILHLICLSITISFASYAQKEANIWYFGDQAGLDFNSGSPVPLSNSQMNTNEGCASIADRNTGQPLFYTDGYIAVWDKNGTVMPGSAAGLLGNYSSTQSAVVVPMPGSTTLYYIFTVDAQAGDPSVSITGYGGLAYSIVDMSLRGGLGDVSTLNTQLIAPTCEKVTAVRHCNGHDIWIVSHQWNTNSFYAYLLTSSGLSAPVVTSVGIVHQDVGSFSNAEAIGYMKFSPNGKKLALAAYTELNTVQIFDFNNSTGVVSNPITDTNFPDITGQDGPYGVSFSPDNSRLYIGVFGYTLYGGTSYVYQYNMNAGNNAAILSSKTAVLTDPSESMGALQLGPDGKLYVAKITEFGNSSYLDVITNPNGLGSACNYVSNGQYLGGLGTSVFGLPDMIESYLSVPITASMTYSDCSGNHTVSFTDNALNGTITTSWNFGDPGSGASNTSAIQNPSHTFSSNGNYTVTVYFSTACGVDSFQQTVAVSGGGSATAGPDTSICSGNYVQLNASGGTTYHWAPLSGFVNPADSTSANPIVIPTATTTYTVTASAGGCNATSTVTVTVATSPPTPTITISGDTLFCSYDPTYTAYQWYDSTSLIPGAINPFVIVSHNGNYNVSVTNESGCGIAVGITVILTGIQNYSFASDELYIYPNPSSAKATVRIPAHLNNGSAIITIADALGKTVFESLITGQQTDIDLSSFASGVYFVNVMQSNNKWVSKLVKE